MDRQVGRYQKGERQVIGDRVVLNPRTRLCSLRDAEGNVFDTFRLSLEVCGCGYSFARAGVGYRGSDGWCCKRCGQLHTLDGKQSASDSACLKPDPSRVREFDVGIRVSPDRSTSGDLEAGAGQQRKGGVDARQGTGSKGQGTRGQGGRIHPAAQAADDSGRGRGAAVRAAGDDRRRAGLPERGRPRTRCAAAQAVHQARRQAADGTGGTGTTATEGKGNTKRRRTR